MIRNLVMQKELQSTPLWLMRQAGRYLSEYRNIRERYSFLDMCYTPSIAAEVTMQPIRRFDFDAAIIFSDILVIPHSFGMDLKFIESTGPVMSTISNKEDVAKLKFKDSAKKLQPVYEAIELVRRELDLFCHPRESGNDKSARILNNYYAKSLIGFAGGVWTLLSYMLEGGSGKNFVASKVFIEENKDLTETLVEMLINAISNHLIAQIEAGADTVQIFDSWAGFLNEEDYWRLVIEPTKKIVKTVKAKHKNVPIIGFPRGSSFFYEAYVKETGVDVLSIDQFVPLNFAKEKLQKHAIIQGNLDNRILFCSKPVIEKAVQEIKDAFGEGRFIFNLGHGVLPGTPVENVEHLVKVVKRVNHTIY